MDLEEKTELEKSIKETKLRIDKKAKIHKKEIDFMVNIFYDESEIIQEYMKKEGITLKEAYSKFSGMMRATVFGSVGTLTIEPNEEKRWKIKDISNEVLYVRLGYFQPSSMFGYINPEEYFKSCPLELTEKGRFIQKEYNQIS